MKAAVIKNYGEPDQLSIENVEKPSLDSGQVLIRVKAFGVNRAETYMRRGVWGDVAKITGIECVGEIESDPSGKLKKGQKVAAIMGGMGRVINGSYAEYTSISENNVFPVETNLSWEHLAAIPESYATAWFCLHNNLKISANKTLFVRGGTSSLAQAAINIASNIEGVEVIASTRNQENVELLKSIGASYVIVDTGSIAQEVKKIYPNGVDMVLDIIGNSVLLDSLRSVKHNGYMCNAGFLGGGDPISFNPLMDLPSTVNLNFFASFLFGTEGFPISSIPMQEIINNVEKGNYKASPSKVFDFSDVVKAHTLMESDKAKGKIVVSFS